MRRFRIPQSKPSLGADEMRAVASVLSSSDIASGKVTRQFEEKFSEYIGVEDAIATNSCASALFITLIANGIRGEVILPTLTFAASANAIVAAGATPVFADVSIETLNIDPSHVESLITENTEAIMVVHFAGRTCDMPAIQSLAKKYGLLIIEDSAQTIGGKMDGQFSGSFGIGCFSFFPSKNMTTGEGGMITLSDSSLTTKCRSLINHGIDRGNSISSLRPWERVATEIGFNFRMNNIQSAIGLCQVDRIDELNAKRRKAAESYNANLTKSVDIEVPTACARVHHVYQMYIIRLNPELDRDRIVMSLRETGIEASVHFRPLLHEQTIYNRGIDYELKNAEALSNSIISLPIYPDITPQKVDFVSNKLLASLQ